MRNKIFIGLFLFFSVLTYNSHADDLPTTSYRTDYATINTKCSGYYKLTNVDTVHDYMYSTSDKGDFYEMPTGTGYSTFHWRQESYNYPYAYYFRDRYECVTTPVCTGTDILNTSTDGNWYCEAPACTTPDEPFIDDVASTYTAVVQGAVNCVGDANTTATAESALIDCVTYNRCKFTPSDDDGDGFSNVEDAFPNDASEWLDDDGDGYGNNGDIFPNDASEWADNDGDGYGDNIDRDDDGDGYSDEEEIARGTDPFSGGSNTATEEGCDVDKLGLNEKFATDCVRVCIDGFEKDLFKVCQPVEIDIVYDCSHADIDSRTKYPFQQFTYNFTDCRKLINAHGGNGYSDGIPLCDEGNVACYYPNVAKPQLDTNQTLEGNGTVFDDRNIVNGLSNIEDTLDTTNTNLGFITDSINIQTSTLSDKLDSLSDVTSQGSDNIDKSINSMSSTLSDKLTNIEIAINNQPTAPATDLTETNSLLTELNDKMADREEGRTELDTENGRGSGALNDALLSFGQTKADMLSLANGMTAPTVTNSGSCNLATGATTFGAISFDFAFMSQLRPYFQFFLNLFLLYITIKFYTIIGRDVAKLVTLL